MLALLIVAGCDDAAPADAPWLDDYLADVIGELAAAPRATPTERAATRAALIGRLRALGWAPEEQIYPGGANVIAALPATTGDAATIVVGAHFDTVAGSPGANDNASGAAVVLAVARHLAESPNRTSPVLVAFFDQEETGLFGSRALAEQLAVDEVAAVHTIDQVAWDGDGDRTFELEQPAPAIEAAWRAAATELGATIVTTQTGGTDHVSFRNAGFRSAGLTEEFAAGDSSPHRHTPADTAATVDAAFIALAARLAIRVIAGAATR